MNSVPAIHRRSHRQLRPVIGAESTSAATWMPLMNRVATVSPKVCSSITSNMPTFATAAAACQSGANRSRSRRSIWRSPDRPSSIRESPLAPMRRLRRRPIPLPRPGSPTSHSRRVASSHPISRVSAPISMATTSPTTASMDCSSGWQHEPAKPCNRSPPRLVSTIPISLTSCPKT